MGTKFTTVRVAEQETGVYLCRMRRRECCDHALNAAAMLEPVCRSSISQQKMVQSLHYVPPPTLA